MALITREEAKEFLEVAHAAQDLRIDLMIAGAQNYVEKYCGVAFSEETKVETLDGGGFALWPTRRPVLSVSKVEFIEDLTNIDTIEVENIRVADDQIIRTHRIRWFKGRNNYRATYIGGYKDADVPPGLKLGTLDMIRRRYDNRGGVSNQSVAGFSTGWQKFTEADFIAELSAFRKGGIIG